jgi:hypothetical protein
MAAIPLGILPIAIGCTAILWLASSRVEAAASAASNEAKPVVYRRVFVPAGKVDAWPTEGEKFLPIDAREFESRVKRINASTESKNLATIETAEYRARLDHDRLIIGQGKWTIQVRDDGSTFLPLGEPSVSIRDARWQNAPQEPVHIGAWGRNREDSLRFGLAVPRSGTLEFSWQAGGHSVQHDIEIPWRVPDANSTKLIIDLPDGRKPAMEGAVVLATHALPPAAPEGTAVWRRWEMALPSGSHASLRIVREDRKSSDVSNQSTLHEATRYSLTERGLEIESVWHIEYLASLPRELVLPLAKGLHLTAVKADGRDVPWRVVHDDKTATDSAQIELPDAAPAKGFEVTVSAWHPLVVAEPWTLPKLTPQDLFWASGTLELSVPSQFELRALEASDCAQTGRNTAAQEVVGEEVHSFTSFSPTSQLKVVVSSRAPRPSVRLGSSLAMGDSDVSGRLVSNWRVANDSIHQISGEIAAAWIVEGVETVPANALGNWFIDRRNGRRFLDIQLAGSINPRQPVTVIVSARLKQFGLNEPIFASTLRIVKWNNAEVARHLLSFDAVEPFAVEPVGGLASPSAAELDDEDRALLDPSHRQNLIFDLTDSDSGGLQISFKRGQYAADVSLEVTCARQQLQQTYNLRIRPVSTAIDRLLVTFYEPLPAAPQWVDKSSGALVSAERLAENLPPGVASHNFREVWLLRLPRPTSTAFELMTTVTSSWVSKKQIPLLSLPEALGQQCQVRLRAPLSMSPLIDYRALQAVALTPDHSDNSKDSSPPIRAVYRYSPADDTEPQAPQLWLTPTASNGVSALLAGNVNQTSYFFADGRASHRVLYELRNRGASAFNVSLPTTARLLGASVDGRAVSPPVGAKSPRHLQVNLPKGETSATVVIDFETRSDPLRTGTKLYPPSLDVNVPYYGGKWTVWLPDPFRARDESHADGNLGWRQRLFGPIARPGGSHPFNPFESSAWATAAEGALKWLEDIGVQTATAKSTAAQTTPAGWHATSVDFIVAAPRPLEVKNEPALNAWSIALFLACFVAGGWLRRRSLQTYLVLLATVATCGILAPVAFAPLAAAAFLGMLASLLWGRRTSNSETDRPLQPWQRAATAGAFGIAVAAATLDYTFGQTGPASGAAPSDGSPGAIHRVLIPVDDKARPTGTKYFVSEALFRVLMRESVADAESDGDWVLESASYSGELRQGADRPQVVAGDWTLTFAIQTFRRDTSVVLPLERDNASWATTAMLDGIPVPLTWYENDSTCGITVDEPGRYHLAISCKPRTTTDESSSSELRLAIPATLASTIQLNKPPALTKLEISQLQPLGDESDMPQQLAMNLLPTRELQLRWPPSIAGSGMVEGSPTTELRWIRLTRSGAELEEKCFLEDRSPLPKSLTFHVGESWRLIPPQDKRLVVNQDTDGTVVVRLPAKDEDRRELALRWSLTRSTSIGRLRLPNLELPSSLVVRRWTAISIDAALDYEVVDESATTATESEFMTLWGGDSAIDPPQLVLSDTNFDRGLVLAVQPRRVETTVDQVLHLAATRRAAQVSYRADISPGSDCYQLALRAPAELVIRQITLAARGRSVPVRWSQNEDRINLFFSEGVAGSFQLTLDGEVPLNDSAAAAIPKFDVLNATNGVQRLQLYRSEDVDAEVRGAHREGEAPQQSVDPAPTDWPYRLVGSIAEAAGAGSAQLIVTPNLIKLQGACLTSLTRAGDSWSADFRCRASIGGGKLGVLQLNVPTSWIGPFEIEANAAASINVVAANEQSAVLSVRFANPIDSGRMLDMVIRGPLAVTNLSPVQVPQIQIADQPALASYVNVPTSIEGQTIAWSDVGVRPVDLPPELRRSQPGQRQTRSFEIVSRPFRVGFQSQVTKLPAPRIRLADTAIVDGPNGGRLILTRFTVASQGLSDCTLHVPTDQNLLAVNLDGQPALIHRSSEQSWQLELGSALLPQVVEVITSVASNEASSAGLKRRPSLAVGTKPIPVELSLWSFFGPGAPAVTQAHDAASVSAADQAALRLDRSISIAEAATPLATELSLHNDNSWFVFWVDLLTRLRDEAKQAAQQSRQASASQVVPLVDDQLSRAVERLDAWMEQHQESLPKRAVQQPAAADSQARPGNLAWPLSLTAGVQQSYFIADGGSNRLPADMALERAAPWRSQGLAIFLITGVAIAGVLILRSTNAVEFICRWPHAVGVLIGILYWAWLWPSWLGLAIAASSVLMALRPGWPGHSARAEGSTVLRTAAQASVPSIE